MLSSTTGHQVLPGLDLGMMSALLQNVFVHLVSSHLGMNSLRKTQWQFTSHVWKCFPRSIVNKVSPNSSIGNSRKTLNPFWDHIIPHCKSTLYKQVQIFSCLFSKSLYLTLATLRCMDQLSKSPSQQGWETLPKCCTWPFPCTSLSWDIGMWL